MRNLKTIAKTVRADFIRIGFNPITEQTDFLVKLGGETFEFHCGLLACIPEDVRIKMRRYYLTSPATKYTNESRIFNLILSSRIRAEKNLDVPAVMRVFEAISKANQPTVYDFLYCMQSDARASGMTFNQFCDELGYNTDSIKDLRTFTSCQDGAMKLERALGSALYRELLEADPDEDAAE